MHAMIFNDMVDKETCQKPDINEDPVQEKMKESLDMSNKESEVLDSTTLENDIEAASAPISERLDWDSPDDLGNPRNWPVPKKIFHTVVPALYGFIT
jgi:hypothetical protein